MNTTIHFSEQQRGPLSHLLFGQFMERASFGEPGPESACDENGALRPKAFELLKDMAPPIVRFPGGTDVDFLDWHDLVDYAPGRAQERRPTATGRNDRYIGTRFGVIEYLRCMGAIDAEPLLVVNIAESWLAADKHTAIGHHCAAMLAYVNAPLENNLPAHLKAYPEARAKAGYPEPFNVKKWQIGNETWILSRQRKEMPQEEQDWLLLQKECLDIAITAMKAVDPDIELIIDGGTLEQLKINHQAFKDQVGYFCIHHYKPMNGRILIDRRTGDEVTPDTLSAEELYRWMVAAPDADKDGYSVYDKNVLPYIKEHDLPIAFTEWNWNGWFGTDVAENNWHWRGVGAAGMLHALMRESRYFKLACQSMLIGSGWGIMAIWVHPEDAFEPFMNPSGMVTSLYSKHHGDEILDCLISGNETYDAVYSNGHHAVINKAVWIDALVSRDAEQIYIHVINRRRELRAWISVQGIDLVGKQARIYSIVEDSPWQQHRTQSASRLDEVSFTVNKEQSFELPACSVSVIELRT